MCLHSKPVSLNHCLVQLRISKGSPPGVITIGLDLAYGSEIPQEFRRAHARSHRGVRRLGQFNPRAHISFFAVYRCTECVIGEASLGISETQRNGLYLPHSVEHTHGSPSEWNPRRHTQDKQKMDILWFFIELNKSYVWYKLVQVVSDSPQRLRAHGGVSWVYPVTPAPDSACTRAEIWHRKYSSPYSIVVYITLPYLFVAEYPSDIHTAAPGKIGAQTGLAHYSGLSSSIYSVPNLASESVSLKRHGLLRAWRVNARGMGRVRLGIRTTKESRMGLTEYVRFLHESSFVSGRSGLSRGAENNVPGICLPSKSLILKGFVSCKRRTSRRDELTCQTSWDGEVATEIFPASGAKASIRRKANEAMSVNVGEGQDKKELCLTNGM
ncbi:hypothetical protein DFP72DRAFT_849272 [Ephemerocybe angulata]|uniref:Uncharacterized protein n=1 Tax=Ephemerocybe angulata TaxID=980116 RepID=A0A8H6HVW1_9AGAR|nr:hypothetical protein DFP72DRAFT_849272 [Tulosesus angulatus]